jgi:iron-sulfur cluster repair protein YtfE (RIC family)
MTSSRIDFYTKVHKGLRARLFRFSERAATADYQQQAVVRELSRELAALLAQLTAHAGHEQRFIHPLLERKASRLAFDGEHEALEADQLALARLLGEVEEAAPLQRQAHGLAFYRALNVFIARYLRHLAAEEETMSLLWERCTDAELGAVMASFGASRPLEEALADMGWMLPALSAAEKSEMIRGMSAALGRGA